MKRVLHIFIWVLVAAIFVGTFVYLYMNSKKDATTYQLVMPTHGNIERTTVLNGKIEPRDEIEIKPQISGIISEILVKAGDQVKVGDVIAKIKVIPEASALSSALNRIDVAKIALEDARAKYERNKALYDKKIVSREDFETSQTTYEQAKKELESAQDSYRIVREGVSQYNASESNTLVRATITGLVLDVPVKVGTSVIQANTFNDGTTIATIADMSDLIFKGTVDETEVGLLSVGMPMTIEIGALPDVHPEGTIEYIAPKGSESNGANTFEVKAAINLENSLSLRAGYSANAKVILNSVNNVLTVPEGVIEYVGDSTFVYCLTDTVPAQKFERRAITTGLGDGINIEVKSGIDSLVQLRGDEIHK